ncbi:uncharacterized protein LOC144093478 [Amblyomma americanum]
MMNQPQGVDWEEEIRPSPSWDALYAEYERRATSRVVQPTQQATSPLPVGEESSSVRVQRWLFNTPSPDARRCFSVGPCIGWPLSRIQPSSDRGEPDAPGLLPWHPAGIDGHGPLAASRRRSYSSPAAPMQAQIEDGATNNAVGTAPISARPQA